MSGTRQFNVRVPDEARDVLTRIATRIREDRTFIDRINGWLDTVEDGTADDSLAERVARIEAALAERGPVTVTTPSGTPPNTPDDTPPLTTGEGRGLRLTEAGEHDLALRIGAGQPDEDIAAAMGISTNTVRARRKKIGERLL